jgi:hypothetical protein
MIINKAAARAILREENTQVESGPISKPWMQRFERLSDLCDGSARTHIAALGTALLAKAADLNVDVFALKRGKGGPRAYSARGLAEEVLAPEAARLGIDIGVTGPEPLNNQPYFREPRISREMPVRPNARPTLFELCNILELLDRIESAQEARLVLRTFIHVRRKRLPRYAPGAAARSLSLEELAALIEAFVGEHSEGGRRAQACVAGLMDVVAAPERVITGRVNDPDRKFPGDVGVLAQIDPSSWERVFEVRDKPIIDADLHFFGQKCAIASIGRGAIIAGAIDQEGFDPHEPLRLIEERMKVTVTVFFSWKEFVRSTLFWLGSPDPTLPSKAAEAIYKRLVAIEVSEEGAAVWLERTTSHLPQENEQSGN